MECKGCKKLTKSRSKYCSEKCKQRLKYCKKNNLTFYVERKQICLFCSKETIDNSKNHVKKFCSNKCRERSHSPNLQPKMICKFCLVCNKSFQDKTDNKLKQHCSTLCLEKSREINKRIRENNRRKALGLPLIGEGYLKEIELITIVQNIFAECSIIVHSRKILGKWNKSTGLELDIYIPELKLAFEYMGEQHYNFKAFNELTLGKGSLEQFAAQKYRDRCKKSLCKIKGISLINVKYSEKLSEQLIRNKLKFLEIINEY